MSAPLVKDGYTVVTASDGGQALTQLEKEAPDLMLLDVVMQGMNGYQLCRNLRRDPRYAKLPIIMVTSKDLETDRAWGMRQGATEYLTKPFGTEQLLSTVRRYT